MKSAFFLLLVITTATSCYHAYYSPNTANAPFLSEKGEARINTLYASGSNSDFQGGEIQAAVAVSKNIGVMINGMFVGRTEDVSDVYGRSSHEESGKGSYVEFGGGAFKNFDEKKKWIGEIYAGFGTGNVNNSYQNNRMSKVGISKFFLQPAVGYKSRYFEFAIVPKVSFVNWKVKKDEILNSDQSSYNYSDEMDLSHIRQKPNFVCFEPSLILRAGAESFKVQGALSFCNFNDDYYAVENLNASIGISINIRPQKK
jgi:hypothetical protein